MTDMELTELRRDDYPGASELAALAREIWTEHYTPIIGRAQVDYMLDKFQTAERILGDVDTGGYRYFMARDDAGLTGYCAIRPDRESGGIFLSKLYVKKSCRGRGLARIFLNKLLEIAAEGNADHIWLTVNKNNSDSIAAYKRLGFEIAEEIVADIGNGYAMDDYKMRLQIHR